ncbi:MAG: hypothetical protein QGI37_08080 [Verrucomicrobiota bacterium]|jgi:hypothetical protein|nr:hypothetical protein [Verrucomicrobiota bacterium]MDP7441698.1 hypothetical protein [Verrucomicrobiota bacterium]|tara:strand:- start:1201 stop:1758 length:558 start_codon:yes stop_codon:yes gene_type:complete
MIRELLTGATVVVGFGVLAYGVIATYRRHKEWKDAWNECDNPKVPDLRKHWCRNCKGHHGIYGGDREKTKCKKCDSTDVHRVTPITLWQKFGYSLPALAFLTLGIVVQVLDINFSALICYGLAVPCVLGFAYVCSTKSAVRNEWLIWAKERGYEENVEKSEGQKRRNPLKKERKKFRSLKSVLGQ